MRSCSVSIILALSALAAVSDAKLTNLFKKSIRLPTFNKAAALELSSANGWPEVNWMNNYYFTGKMYTLNNHTSKLESYLNMTDVVYYNSD